MKIGFVTRKAWPAPGGAEFHLKLLSEELATEDNVRILAQGTADRPIRPVRDVVLPPRGFRAAGDGEVALAQLRIPLVPRARVVASALSERTKAFARRTKRIPPHAHAVFARAVGPSIATSLRGSDVLHVVCGGNVATAAVHAASLLGVPSVVSPFAHQGQWDDDEASGSAYANADAVIATLNTDAEIYLDLGVDPWRVRVSGVCSAPLSAPARNTVRENEGIAGPLVVFVGLRRPHKGVDLLLEAAEILRERQIDLTVALIGPGPEADGDRPWLRDLGSVDAATKAAWVQAADALCLPSSGESFGLVVTEAWSVGTPVVTSDIPTLRELVNAGQGGLTSAREPRSLAAALERLLSSPEEAQRMGESGRKYWDENFRPDRVARFHRKLYQELKEERSRGASACHP